MGHLWDALCRAYDLLGFAEAAGGDEVFRQLVLAREFYGSEPRYSYFTGCSNGPAR